MSKRVFCAGMLGLMTFIAPEAGLATQVNLQEVPTNWRLQNYVGGAMWVYYTSAPSPCPDGGLQLPPSATSDELNRFWSLVLTAKTTGAQVGIYYDSVTCLISSFYAPP